ncbi:MAG: peptide MFS transporter [Proteobacteria bacterium]|nr:peptide MFS transporter [Pseudomonadota bacterium]
MGERFGYYTMLAIFSLFIQAKYGFTAAETTQTFAIFLAAVYFMPLVGGFLADRFLGYGRTISIGLVVMFAGYGLLAIPSGMDTGPALVFVALGVIALGTGLFKGNLQALVGNLYDAPEYSKNRDVAFNIFYMGINIGAMFAPTAADTVSNWILAKKGLFYAADIPALAHKYLAGDESVAERLGALAAAQPTQFGSLGEFSKTYIDTLSESYHTAFGVACVSLVVSMIVFWTCRRYYKHADMTEVQKAKSEAHKAQIVELTPAQIKSRFFALGLVFFVVIFFWMAFHQNGAAMTIFARDYTVGSVGHFTNIWFDLFGLLPIFLAVLGLVFLVRPGSKPLARAIGAAALVGFGALAYFRISSYGASNPFTPQKFQHFNPFFIVVLTPVIVGLFSWLRGRGKEPSAPKKIGIGMVITAIGFTILVVGSIGLIGLSPGEIDEVRAPAESLISPYWLISTYFTLTIAELFLSPMGISFVSKVAPPKYKGLMQGGWFAATGVGNYAVGLMGLLWAEVALWMFWAILVACCVLSALFIFSVLKKLEQAAKA